VDASEDGVALARGKYPQVRFEVRSAYDDLGNLGPTGGFDLAVSTEVIEHLHSPARFLKAVHAALRPRGRLVLSTPYHGFAKNLGLALFNAWDRHFTADWEGGHIKFFSRRTLGLALQRAGFEVVGFHGAGRLPYLWKSMVVTAEKR
jgi:2-polyprenyl-6-hydroxyphenyl methylase/3-demethylubiquinone-9 3-methyltransferase